MNEIVIVGAGQSAAQCIIALRKGGFNNPITLIGEESHLPYQRPPLSKDYLSDEAPIERVFMKPEEFFIKEKIKVIKSTKATSINREKNTVVLENGENIKYKKLILATGSRVRRIEVEGSELKNINYLRTLDDANAIKKFLKSGKKLVIVGAGYIGLEVAAVAVEKGLDVTVIEMADRVMNRTVDPIISEYFYNLHTSKGVKIILNSALVKFEGEESVEKVICSNGDSLKADGVIIGAGILPNQEIAESCNLECSNGIVVDEHGQTLDKDIYACGDCTNHPNPSLNKRLRLESVHNALEQAKTVALNLMGEKHSYDQVPWFWSDQYEHKLQIVGISGNHDRTLIRGSIDEKSFMVFYLKNNELIAVDSVNNSKDFLVSKKLVANKLKISSDILCDQSVDLKNLIT